MMMNILRTATRFHTVKNMLQLSKLVGEIKTPYILDFYADWCGHCQKLWLALEKREKESQGKWTIVKIDVENKDLAEVVKSHSFKVVPTLAFYKGMEKLYQRSGVLDEAGLKELEQKYLKN